MRTTCFIKRSKEDVLKELPPLTRETVECDIDNLEEYNQAKNNLLKYLEDVRLFSKDRLNKVAQAEVLVQVNYLKEISARGMLSTVIEFVENLIEQDEKVIIFAHHKALINQLVEHFKTTLVITGQTPGQKRQQIIDEFQNNPNNKLIILSLRAASESINIQKASTIVNAELDWNPAIHEQGEGRAHRMGNLNAAITSYYFIARNTIMQSIYDIIENKRDIANQATGSEDNVKRKASVYAELMKAEFNIDYENFDNETVLSVEDNEDQASESETSASSDQ